jgi:hypothetical protein
MFPPEQNTDYSKDTQQSCFGHFIIEGCSIQAGGFPLHLSATISYDITKEFRETFAAWQDADGDAVKVIN